MQIKPKNKKKYELFFLVALGIISLILRFYSIGKPDFYFDEAIQAMSIKDFVASHDYSYLYLFGHPPLFMMLMSVPAALFGVKEFSVRIVDAFFGTLAVFVVYFLAKLWYGRKTAVVSALIFAVAPLTVIYSRLAFGYSLSMFFTISSVFLVEYLIKKKLKGKKEILSVIAAGVFIGATLLTRYNSLPVLGLYWLFVLSYSFIKERKYFNKYLKYAIFINIIAVILFLAVVVSFGGFPRLVYVIHNFFFVIFQQTTESRNPFYYHIAVLFDGISPFLYFILPFAFLYLLLRNKKREDLMISIIVLIFFIIITVQQRRFSRHQLVIYPFLIILLSRFIIGAGSGYFSGSLNKILCILLIGTFLWSIFLIYKMHDFDVWSKVGDYIEKNYDSSVKVHSGYIRNRQLQTHISRPVDVSGNLSRLNKDDLVVFAFLYGNTTVLENSPMEGKSTLFSNPVAAEQNRKLEFDNDYYRFVLSHGTLVKEFIYNGGTSVWLYKINNLKGIGQYSSKFINGNELQTSLLGLWEMICRNFGTGNFIDKMLNSAISPIQKIEIEKHCKSNNA